MTKPIFAVLAFVVSTPVLAQERLPLRSAPGEVTIRITDDDGESIPGADIRLTGPTLREALTDHNAHVIFTDLAAGSYRVTIQAGTLPPIEQTMTVVGGLSYEAQWRVPSSSFPKEPSTAAASTLGPLRVSQVFVDEHNSVGYVLTNRSRDLLFHRLEITRVFGDGSSRVDIQEDDAFDGRAITWLRFALSLYADGWSPIHTATQLQAPLESGRRDAPVWAGVRPLAVVTAGGVTLGDPVAIRAVIERRRWLVAELEYWIGRYEAQMRRLGGVLLSDLLAEELESPVARERTSDYRLALLSGIRNVRAGGADDTYADGLVLGQFKSMIQFRDFALDQLRVLEN